MASIDLSELKQQAPLATSDDPTPVVHSEKETHTYKDIQLDMSYGIGSGNMPVNKAVNTTDIKALRDKEDIKQALTNILNTSPGQKLLNPDLGLNLSKYLFDPISASVANTLSRAIGLGLPLQEPRIGVEKIAVFGNTDNHVYDVTVTLSYTDDKLSNEVYKATLTQEGFEFK